MSGFGGGRFAVVSFVDQDLPAIVYPDSDRDWFWALGWIMALAFLALTGLTLLIGTVDPDWPRLVGLLAVAAMLFLFAPLGLYLQLAEIRRLALTRLGVHMGHASTIFIPWDSIVGADVRSRYLMTYVEISVRDVRAVAAPNWLSRLITVGRNRIAVGSADRRRTNEAAVVIDYYARRPEERQAIGMNSPSGLAAPPQPGRKPSVRLAREIGRVAWLGLALFFLALLSLGLIGRLQGG